MFTPLNKENVSNSLQIDRQGELNGSTNVPSSTSDELTGTEEAIIEKVGDHWTTVTEQNVKKPLDALENRFEVMKGLRKANGHRTMITGAKAKLDAIKGKITVDSERASEDIIKAFYDLDIFKKRNERIENPIVKEQDAITKSILLLFFLAGLEMYMNAQLLAPAMRGTIATTLMLVFAISMVNILGSFLYGRIALRNFHHVKRMKNTFATVATAIFIPLVLHFNIAMGVFRGLAEKATSAFDLDQMGDAGRQAFWPYDNFADQTLEGGLLSIAGIIFACIAMIDGYKFSDEYPGYGRLGKIFKQAQNRLREVESDALLSFTGQRKSASDAVNNLETRRQQANEDWRKAVNELQSLYEDYDDFAGKLQKDGNSLINKYRTANRKLRTSPPPAIFHQPIDFKIKSSERFFATVAEHYLDDDQANEKYREMDELIKAEHAAALIEINDYYITETEKLKARLNEVKKTTTNTIHNR